MRKRPLTLGFKGRTYAPSKPVGRMGKMLPVRPAKRCGYFGFVTPRMEKTALAEADRVYAARQRERPNLEHDRPGRYVRSPERV